jgi:UDPglucose--hexose-1-phosphate uridylyltransferase
MPQYRFNPLTADRVIVAPGRVGRPRVPPAPAGRGELPERDASCPFCPGNEKETPAELLRIGADEWSVRVVPNKFAALEEGEEPAAVESSSYRYVQPAVGRHEVIVETPYHNRDLPDLGDEDVLAVMQAYRARFAEAASDRRIKCVVIFRNYGPMANASIVHAHSQLAALSFVPHAVSRIFEHSKEHRGAGGHALLFDVVSEEVKDGARLIEERDRFATFVPFAPAHDYEVWVAPAFVPPRFDRVDDETLASFAAAVRRAAAAVDQTLGGPDYNLILHTPPLVDGAEAVLPWYVQIIPRLTLAGFEIGVGVHVLVTEPEEAAAKLKAGLAEVAEL